MPTDKSQCIPVMPNGTCPGCGWEWGNNVEPHAVLPHGGPKAVQLGKCSNCGTLWNLDAVKCSSCGFVPNSPEMFDALRADKNRARHSQFLPPLATRPEPIMVNVPRKKVAAADNG